MKRWIIGAASALGLSLVALLGVSAYVAIGRNLGERWSSFDGPEPTWPVSVGFGSMWLAAISATVLILLILVAIVRAYFPRVKAHQGEAPE